MNLAERAAATEQTLKRFRDKPFDWAGANCIRLARAQAVAFGHKVPPVPLFRSATGAKKALLKQGVETVEALLDKWFVRLPAPAFARMGDLVAVPGEGGLDAVFVADGQGNLFGWHEEEPSRMVVLKQAEPHITAGWRL